MFGIAVKSDETTVSELTVRCKLDMFDLQDSFAFWQLVRSSTPRALGL